MKALSLGHVLFTAYLRWLLNCQVDVHGQSTQMSLLLDTFFYVYRASCFSIQKSGGALIIVVVVVVVVAALVVVVIVCNVWEHCLARKAEREDSGLS